MVVILLAEGFEEVEALAPLDIMRRANIDVVTVGVAGREVTGTHGITVKADLTPEELDIDAVDTLVLPGGMPGTLNLDASELTDKLIGSVDKRGGMIAAICAAPLILGRRGLLRGKRATCFPGFEDELVGAKTCDAAVVADGRIVTAKNYEAALEFGHTLARAIESRGKDACDNNEYYGDEKFLEAAKIAIENGSVTTSLLQRKLFIGYGKAASYIDAMEECGIVSARCGAAPRDVLITMEEWRNRLSRIG